MTKPIIPPQLLELDWLHSNHQALSNEHLKCRLSSLEPWLAACLYRLERNRIMVQRQTKARRMNMLIRGIICAVLALGIYLAN